MTFGLLKHFKENKKSAAENRSLTYHQHLVVGQDLGSVLKLLELRKTHPAESVRLVSTKPVSRQALIEAYQFGVTQLRSSHAVEGILKKFHGARLLPHRNPPVFYKDGKFHEFNGRAKPMELLSGEEFFSHRGYKLELSSLFSTEDWENLDGILTAHQEVKHLETIEKTDPQDLVERTEWKLSFKDFSVITCESIYVSMSSKKFLDRLGAKERMSRELIEVCSSVDVKSAVSVTWRLNREIFPEERTLFIPQSMTHEWGHFMVEFENTEPGSNAQLCHVLFLIHEDLQSEDLALKIKLMKRVVDRVFPELEKSIVTESLRFDDEMLISGIKDRLLEQVSFDYPNLRFTGQLSPMQTEFQNEHFLARTLLN